MVDIPRKYQKHGYIEQCKQCNDFSVLHCGETAQTDIRNQRIGEHDIPTAQRRNAYGEIDEDGECQQEGVDVPTCRRVGLYVRFAFSGKNESDDVYRQQHEGFKDTSDPNIARSALVYLEHVVAVDIGFVVCCQRAWQKVCNMGEKGERRRRKHKRQHQQDEGCRMMALQPIVGRNDKEQNEKGSMNERGKCQQDEIAILLIHTYLEQRKQCNPIGSVETEHIHSKYLRYGEEKEDT